MRINQYLARCGVCSRRGADKLINERRITINGVFAELGSSVDGTEEVCLDGKKLELPDEHIVVAYYKPVGVTCTEADIHAKRKVIDEIDVGRRVTYAGRLDKDSEGLLLLTDDGNLIDAMMRGSNFHEKEYVVIVDKSLKTEDLEAMAAGVYLKDLDQTTRPCTITKVSKNTFNIILTQGLNRQIRRMCEAYGYKVTRLLRTRVMNVELQDLQVGASRLLDDAEREKLYKLCMNNEK